MNNQHQVYFRNLKYSNLFYFTERCISSFVVFFFESVNGGVRPHEHFIETVASQKPTTEFYKGVVPNILIII